MLLSLLCKLCVCVKLNLWNLPNHSCSQLQPFKGVFAIFEMRTKEMPHLESRNVYLSTFPKDLKTYIICIVLIRKKFHYLYHTPLVIEAVRMYSISRKTWATPTFYYTDCVRIIFYFDLSLSVRVSVLYYYVQMKYMKLFWNITVYFEKS